MFYLILPETTVDSRFRFYYGGSAKIDKKKGRPNDRKFICKDYKENFQVLPQENLLPFISGQTYTGPGTATENKRISALNLNVKC